MNDTYAPDAPGEPAAKPRIVIGGDHNFPPFEYLDENGLPTGYNVEIMRAIAQEAGMDIEIRLGPWADIRKGMQTGEINAIQGIFYSPERALKLEFTQPHVAVHYVSIINGPGTPPESIRDLEGKRIVVQQGDIIHDFALQMGLQNPQITAVDSQEDALRALIEGKHDCALVARPTALYLIRKNGWRHLTVGRSSLLSPEYCIAVARGNKALLAQFQEGLAILDQTGEYRRIHAKWLGRYEGSAQNAAAMLKYVALAAILLLLVLLVFFVWSWSLRKQVARRTEEVRQNAKQFRALVEGAPDAIFVQTQYRFAYLNTAAYTLFDPEQPLLGMPVLDHFHPDEREEVKARIGNPINDKMDPARQAQAAFRLKDGEVLVELSSVPIIFDGKQATLVFVRDMTERRRSEQALQESEEIYRRLVENASEAIFVAQHNRLVFSNSVTKAISGYAADQLETRPFTDFIHPEDRQMVMERHQARLKNENLPRGYSFRIIHRDGGPRWVALNTIPLEWNGEPATLNFMTDITDRKLAEQEREKLEAQLLQAQKMESIGRLAGGVAHDYNNMLNVIIGYADLSMTKVAPHDPLHHYLNEILKAANRSADITRQLLAYARKQTITPTDLDLNETMAGMLKMLQRLIGEDIVLGFTPKPGLWPVKMDPAQLGQILANLCVNARDAIVGVGRVSIETDNVTFDEAFCAAHPGTFPGDFVLLAVSDDGCGMDKQTIAQLFEPFFTTKEVGKGTGLGLATVYGIVKQNDGFINVYSEPEKGTIFKIYLPRCTGSACPIPIENLPAAVPGGSEIILLVEDEPSILDLGKEMLEKLGYTVLAANSPGEAMRLALAHAGEIDLLITDIIMPEMNGRDLSQKLLTDYPKLKILFMSGYTASVIAPRGELHEGENFIQKPFSYMDLAAKVRDTLSQLKP